MPRTRCIVGLGRGPAQLEKTAGYFRIEANFPFPRFIGRYRFGLLVEANRDLFFTIGPAPNRYGMVSLQNHIVTKNFGQFHIG